MNAAPALRISPRMVEHFASFQSGRGLWRLKTHLAIRRLSLAWGATPIDWRADSSHTVPDPLLLCSLVHPRCSALPDGRAPRVAKSSNRRPSILAGAENSPALRPSGG